MQELSSFFSSVLGVSASVGDKLALVSLVVTVLAAIVGVVQTMFGVLQWKEARIASARDVGRAAKALHAQSVASYTRDDLRHVARSYVEPKLSPLDPGGSESHRQVLTTGEDAFSAISKFLKTKHKETKFLLLLADSGMGKTSLLLALYLKAERNKGYFAGLRVVVIPCGLPGILEKISAIQEKHETVLCLDGFDEDTEAIRDHQTRLFVLLQSTGDFAAIIVTCRTQFFRSDEEIPRRTGVAIVRPRSARVIGEYLLYKLYVAPFDDDQIVRYVKKNIGFLNRKRALATIREIPDLAIRPMLLALIPSIVEQHLQLANVRTKFDLYAYMIESWLTRESSWVDPDELRSFSELIAFDVFSNRLTRGSEVMPRDHFNSLCSKHAPSTAIWKLSGRSLLIRNSDGALKFAHRSIMEFMFVCAALRQNSDGYAVSPMAWQLEWTDMMEGFVVDLWSSVDRDLHRLSTMQCDLLAVGPSRDTISAGWTFSKAALAVASLDNLVNKQRQAHRSLEPLRSYFSTIHFGHGTTLLVEETVVSATIWPPIRFDCRVWMIFAPLGMIDEHLQTYCVRNGLVATYSELVRKCLEAFMKTQLGGLIPNSADFSMELGIPASNEFVELTSLVAFKPALASKLSLTSSGREARAFKQLMELDPTFFKTANSGVNTVLMDSGKSMRTVADGHGNATLRLPPKSHLFPIVEFAGQPDAIPIFTVMFRDAVIARAWVAWATTHLSILRAAA